MEKIILKTINSNITAPLVKEAIKNEMKLIQQGIKSIRKDLDQYEQKHGYKTEEFFKLYKEGKTTDDPDFVDWAGEYQLLLELGKELDNLKEIEVCS